MYSISENEISFYNGSIFQNYLNFSLSFFSIVILARLKRKKWSTPHPRKPEIKKPEKKKTILTN